ncbi:hypothetical protein [Christiangramia echinicola]|uniref:Outer membrane protein beta-barrel domain-containing protein n=1 Tax=Christiangramia echinicola TaxID=279359 RepID=A0A1H1N3X0_9FLAO|nr:hypothetical protein [Christiangramia echinicola]SDR93590.1 hypothetical protein SAMN04488552_1570 [Christiangramia echinicola]
MKERKNIDRIYQEKFKDFEQEPNEEVWKKISSRLDEKEKKRPFIIPLWWKVGGAAAVLALIISSLLFLDTETPLTNEPEVVIENPEKTNQGQDQKLTPKIKENQSGSSEGIVSENYIEEKGKDTSNSDNRSFENNQEIEPNNTVGTKSGTTNSIVSNQNKKATIPVQQIDSSKNRYEKENRVIQTEEVQNKTSGEIARTEKTLIDSTKTKSVLEDQNALAEIEKDKKKTEEEEENLAEVNSKKLRLSTFAAPVFYKNLGSGNELSNQFSGNPSSSDVTFSYGVKVAYQISNKLSIRTGISKVDINNTIQDISYSPAASSVRFDNITPVADNIDIRDNNSSDSGLPTGTMGFSNSVNASVFTPGEISQKFGYIEIPVELEFALINRKFGLNIIGGGSGLFLDNNRVDLISANNKTKLGKASNINSTSFSTNIGLGIDYKLTDKFSISVEPIFKYQLNTFKNVDNVQPTNFGIYSGLNFRF